MERHNVIASGSTGNCVLYHNNSIAVDMGIPYSKIKPFIYSLQLVCLTHSHTDHFNLQTIVRLAKERPTLRFACGEWMLEHLQGIRNVDVLEIGKEYEYKGIYGTKFSIVPVRLFHDVPNQGYRIFKDGYKIFHATDTATLEGITARGYDLYSIEFSYDEDVIGKIIAEKEANGQFAYEKGAINSHLSEQAARQFIFNNAGENYEVLRLHESRREYSKI